MRKIFLLFFILLQTTALFASELGKVDSNNPEITIVHSKDIVEGNSGSKTVNLTVSINECPNKNDIRLRYYTSDGYAKTSDHDYQQKSGIITFSKGDSCNKSQTISVKIYGDKKEEKDEGFYVNYRDNGTIFQNYHWHNGHKETIVYIINDDGYVLDAGKYLVDSKGNYHDSYTYKINDIITFRLIAQNQGPNSTQIKLRDTLTDGIEFIPNSIKITNNVDNYNCQYHNASKKITCSGSHVFAPNTEADIIFKAKAKKEGSFDNYVYITDQNGEHQNGDRVNFKITNYGNGVDISKTVDKSTAKVGDNVNFTIKVTNNTPEDRQLTIRDWFPTNSKGEKSKKTSKNAFKYISYTASSNDIPDDLITCKQIKGRYGPYTKCKNKGTGFLKNKNLLKPGESYQVVIKAKVLRSGKLCNTAYVYINNNVKMNKSKVCLSVKGNFAPTIDVKDQNAYVGSKFTYNIDNEVSDEDGDPVKISVDNLPQGFTYSNGEIKATPVNVAPGTYTVTVTATDDPSARGETPKTTTKSFNIIVSYPSLLVTDNSYSMGVNETLNGNVITDDTGDGKDRGYDLKIKSYTTPSHGTLTMKKDGEFSFKPDQDFKGTVTFTYTAEDGAGTSDTANVTIKVETQYNSRFKDFEIVNPLETRNIIGNYVIAGNTVECVTDLGKDINMSDFTVHFPNGKCQNNRTYFNNDYVVKYIDIDNDDKTWDSSSSYFTIPDSFLKKPNGKGIVWAGIFWQGNVNNTYSFTVNGMPYVNIQRRKDWDSSGNVIANIIAPGFTSGSLDIRKTRANKILVKVDDETNYHEIEASRFYYDSVDYGDSGATYAAYADITNLLQSKNLGKGKHKLTVANILTNEGLEQNNGNYGGWSLVVIYKENFFEGRARNISIYNGFTAVDGTTHGSQQIHISGFKLPKTGTVHSKFSAFVGEGEYVYGAPFKDDDGTAWYDTMRIKRTKSSDGNTMPGADNADNIFDSKLANIQRENVKNNNIANTNGIDIDTYDVSNIITNYRNINPNINGVYLSIKSNKDYITPSMIAFSTELYAPKICYDADIKLGKYLDIQTDDDRNFTAPNTFNKPLQMKVFIKSQEADFDLLDTKLNVSFTPSDVFSYIAGSSKTTKPNNYVYDNAIDTDSNGTIAIGDNPSTDGGTIGAKEFTYSKLYYNFTKADFEGKFDINVDAKVSFDGIHKVEYKLSTKVPEGSIFNIRKCPSNPVYSPIYGAFNVERADAPTSGSAADRYSLNTQVTGVPYKVAVASYKKGSDGVYDVPNDVKTTAELELIDASTFENNSSAGFDSVCNDPDTYGGGKLIEFNNESRKYVKIPEDFPKVNGISTYPVNLALKNATFRLWLLTKKQDNKDVVIPYNCAKKTDYICFRKVYNDYYKNTDIYCSAKCKKGTGSQCYNCLRKHYGKPICARDNFAIRPESYRVAIYDDNQTKAKNRLNIGKNSVNTPFNVAAGYLYGLDINATRFSTSASDITAYGYYLDVLGKEEKKSAIAKFDASNPVACNDKTDKLMHIKMFNGSVIGRKTTSEYNNTSPTNGLKLDNVGDYKLNIIDSEWTQVDQKGYIYKPFRNRADCRKNSNTFDIDISSKNLKGCDITSELGSKYYNLNLESHPYRFNLNGLKALPNPNSASDYIYINDLNQTAQLIPSGDVMAMKIGGLIEAVGKDGQILSNYTKSCAAKNLNISLDYGIITDINGSLNSSDIDYSTYVKGIDSSATVNSATGKKISMNYDKKYFDDSNTSSLGAAEFSTYFNFPRAYNNPVNPFKVYFGNIKVKGIKDASIVDLNKSYIPEVTKDLNSTKNVYYARVKSKKDFYDDIYDSKVETPITVTIYCDKSLDYCNYFGIDTSAINATDEYNWWISKQHTNSEGLPILKVNPNNYASIYPSSVINNFVNGIDKNVEVQAAANKKRPFTVQIQPDGMVPWLLFNKGLNIPPAYIYKVRFVSTSGAWSGAGKTGHTIDVNTSGRRSRKIDW